MTSIKYNGIAEDANLWQLPFKKGIAEDSLSTRWFINHYQELTGYKAKDAKEIIDLYSADCKAREVLHEFGTNLGEFLVHFIQTDQPDIVILGGNICNALELFLPYVKETLERNDIEIAIAKATLGEDAPIIGACSDI